MYLSIIIPLFNEETSIVSVLDKLAMVPLPPVVTALEIVVVDDHSSDRSYEVVQAYAGQRSGIRAFRHPRNMGKGAAVRTGVSHCHGDHILFQDADLELDPRDIPSMVLAMDELKVPFVNGSRYLPGVLRTQASFKRYMANRAMTALTSWFIDVHLTDMACGYKLMTKDLFQGLRMKEDRFGFEAELIIKCGRMRRNWIAEVPVRYMPRNAGEGKKLRNVDGFRIMRTILKYGLFRMD